MIKSRLDEAASNATVLPGRLALSFTDVYGESGGL
jgi:hypothetical protein